MENAQVSNVSPSELEEAFKPEKKPQKLLVAVVILVVGLITLAVGIGVLLLKLFKQPSVQDGDYLVSASNWVLADDERVVWDFTEIGKGTLTTNGHLNDYDFIWTLENGKLKIETNWLYTLNNEYDYQLDQNEGKLTLENGEQEIILKANFESE